MNTFGGLGDGTLADRSKPVAVVTAGTPMDGKKIVAVAAGSYFTAALDDAGQVYTWGRGDSGQLGNGALANSSKPVAVSTSGVLAGKVVVAISAYANHVAALTSEGTVVSWGYGNYGALGNNATANQSTPVALVTAGTPMSGKTVVQVSAGSGFSVARTSDGRLYSWGLGNGGALGNGTSAVTSNPLPVTVTITGTPLAGKTITAIDAGKYHTLVSTSDGGLYAFGGNSVGQLGTGAAGATALTAVAVTRTW